MEGVDDLPQAVATQAYLVLAEAVANAVKHAGPTPRVTVSVSAGHGDIALAVAGGAGAQADAPGADLTPAPAALSRRVAAAGGSLVVTGTPRTGVRVLATLPVAAGASGGETRT